MPQPFETIYASIRAEVLGRHFALGKFWRANHFTNANVLGEVGDCFIPPAGHDGKRGCDIQPCLPRQAGNARYATPPYDPDRDNAPAPADGTPTGVSDVERWRVWYHDHGNGLLMTGLRLIHLAVDHQLGDVLAARVVLSALQTVDALMKFPGDGDFAGYVLRWDTVADDSWELRINPGRATDPVWPTVPCRFLINPEPDKARWEQQPFLYCTPLDDPRYAGNHDQRHFDNRDRMRGWEPSKDEYIGLIAGLNAVWDAFPEGSPQRDLVKTLAGRIARYLQKHAYLLVRPCGGVTFRGCGEILPLLEFAFNHVFEKILGDPFISTRAYRDVMADAGIRFPNQIGAASAAAIDLVLQGLVPVRDFVNAHGFGMSLGIADPVALLTQAQKFELLWLWQNRAMIDALDGQMQAEVLIGYIANKLPRSRRRKAFEVWLRAPGQDISATFKPYIALMLLDDKDDFGRKNYLKWFDIQFPTMPETALRDTNHGDWAFATAVAMLVAHKQGDENRRLLYAFWIEKQLDRMAGDIVADSANAGSDWPRPPLVFGSTTTPLKNGEMSNSAGLSCGADAPRVLVSEAHDRVGNWYGYLPVLALAWRHLRDGAADPFGAGSGIALPTDIVRWPTPAVPRDVIKAVNSDPVRMLVPLSAISRSRPNPLGDVDEPLFKDPPARATDADIARRHTPRPVGNTVTFDFHGSDLASEMMREWPFPDLTDVPDDEREAWIAIATLEVTTNILSDHWSLQSTPVDGKIKLRVWMKPVQIRFSGGGRLRRIERIFAHVAGNVRMAWVRQ